VCVPVQEGRKRYSAEPSPEDMAHFWRMSPIAHISKVQGPMIFMLGAKDRRVSGMPWVPRGTSADFDMMHARHTTPIHFDFLSTGN
jgi:hypothetical protein